MTQRTKTPNQIFDQTNRIMRSANLGEWHITEDNKRTWVPNMGITPFLVKVKEIQDRYIYNIFRAHGITEHSRAAEVNRVWHNAAEPRKVYAREINE